MKKLLLAHFEPFGLLLLALLLRALWLPLPDALRGGESGARPTSVRYTDAAGLLLREVRDESGARAQAVEPGASRSLLADALIEAEDRRFFSHPGLDPLGVARAAWHNLQQGRGGSMQGASTLTMQLARNLVPHPRTLRGKLEEAALSLRIEASLSKDEILQAYLAEAPFGPQLRGAAAAAELLFGKTIAALSPAEAATLAALPKAPGRYLTASGRERLRARRDFVLARLFERGRIDAVALARAQVEPLPERLRGSGFLAPHLIEALRAGRLDPVPSGDTVALSVSVALQARVEAAVAAHVAMLQERHVGAGAALVLDNASGAILAYVGSPSFDGPAGQNDGILALRQPGSSLKPFVYALALETQGLDPASILPDVPLQIEGEDGVFAPRNYDGTFHGPVRLREALGNSYNVPAVWLTDRLGVGTVLGALHRYGFASLREDATHYGAALALGDGEVRLLELAEAYAMLAREGVPVRARALAGGAPIETEARVLSPDVARTVTDLLVDRRARAAAFGEHSVLEFAYPVAVKTGTSKGFRDNVTAGYTREVTVVTWVGNFDGSPMQDVSGVAGAGPLFRAVMELAMQDRTPQPFATPDGGRFARASICPLSGRRAGPACPHRMQEWLRLDRSHGETCTMHEQVAIAADGLRAGPACRSAQLQAFERYEGRYAAWAERARRPLAPATFSPECPGEAAAERSALRIVSPRDGARYQLDPGRPSEAQQLFVEIQGNASSARLDGRPLERQAAGWSLPLAPGAHELVVRDARGSEARARYQVR